MLLLPLFGCSENNPKADGHWIKGDDSTKIKTIEKHLRGLDMAMVETGYRYQELYWAGKDKNWDYASYQLTKLKLAIENGLERRPLRAKSAAHFLQTIVPDMQAALGNKDTTVFNNSYQLLTAGCNSCHVAEKVPFFTIKPPVTRTSTIQ